MKKYLFDFDGTLVDSMPVYVSVMLKILDDEGISYNDDIMKTITPLGVVGSAKYYRSLGVSLSEEEIVKKMEDELYHEYIHNIGAKDGVISSLKELKKRGDDLNILTASPHITLDGCLKRLGIYDLFTNVWSCEDFATTKSDPTIYTKTAKLIGAPVEEILFIDDNLNAVKTAKKAGMKTCGIYDKSSEEYIDEIKAVADNYIFRFEDLLTL